MGWCHRNVLGASGVSEKMPQNYYCGRCDVYGCGLECWFCGDEDLKVDALYSPDQTPATMKFSDADEESLIDGRK